MSLNIKTATDRQVLASNGDVLVGGRDYEVYSENETMIGYWTDGKPLYRRIISGTSPNSDTPVVIPLDIPNAENAHLVYGYITNKGNNYNFPLNYWRASSDSAMFVVADDGTSIVLNVFGSGIYNSKYYAEIRYTKTTDTPVAGTNTYSTEEKLTGETWIDGKPIYRKVFNATCSVAGQPAITIDTSELNIDEVITLNGILTETVSSDNKNKIVLPYTGLSMNGVTELRYSVSNSSITIANTLSGFDNMPINIIIEYTKTTD